MRKYILLTVLIITMTGCTRYGEGDYKETEREELIQEKIREEIRPQETRMYPMEATPSFAGRIDTVIDSEGRYCIYNGKNYGFMTEQGEEITSYIYDAAYPFHEGLACVCMKGKYGFIDLDGGTALPFIYDNASPYTEGLAYFVLGRKYGFMDKEGEPVFYLDCDSISSFKEGLAYFSRDGKYGYIDKDGKTVIKPAYDDADYFENGLAIIRKGGKYGVIDKSGKEMIPPGYDRIVFKDSFIIADSGEHQSCFDREGKKMLEEDYDYIFIEDGFIVMVKNGKYGIADGNGDIRMDPLYDSLYLIPEMGLAIAKDNRYYGIVDFKGEIKVPFIYGGINCDGALDNEAVIVFSGDKYGCLNASDFTESIPVVYDSISCFIDNRAVVKKDNQYGVIHADGHMDIPVEYDNIQIFIDGSYALKKNGITCLYNRNGELLAAGHYDYINRIGECYEVERDGKSGYLNEHGDMVIPPMYDYVTSGVYGQSDARVTLRQDYGIQNSIVKTGSGGGSDISEAVLKNQITPRAGIYEAFAKSGSTKVDGIQDGHVVSRDELNAFIKTYKLYDLDGSGKPILYFSAKPYMTQFYPLVYNGFYAIKDNKLNELICGSESGGSVRGEFAHFWYDSQTSRMMIGTSAVTSGFEHYKGDVYGYADGEVNKTCSFNSTCQFAGNYEKDDLIQNASEFYDEEGNPFTKNTILQAGRVAEYRAEGKRITREAFTELLERYQELMPLTGQGIGQ